MMELIALETEAKQHLSNIRDEWFLFCVKVESIKASDLWRDKFATWGAYCKQTFGVSDSRIRQHLSAHELSGVLETITGVPLTHERQARYIKEFADTPDKQAEIHVLATHAAHELGESVSRRHIKAASDVLDETSVTSGNVSLQGQQVPIFTTGDTLALAVVEEAREASSRYKEYKTQGLQDVPVSVMRIGDKAYAVLQLPNDYPIGLLENYIAKVPKDDKVRKPAMSERLAG